MKSGVAFTVWIAVLIGATAVRSQNKCDPKELVTVEESFAAAVAENGMNAGFREFLAPNGIIFRPGPVNGLELLKDKAESQVLLSWTPEYAEISSAGDLGWTTGPWELRQDSTQPPGLFGQYLSIWQRQPEGDFKLALDIGTVYPEKSEVHEAGFSALSPVDAESLSDAQTRQAEADLLEFDGRFAEDCAREGEAAAYQAVAADDILILRYGEEPRHGVKEMEGALKSEKGAVTWQALAAHVSEHGELGYTYGEGSYQPPGSDPDEAQPFAYAAVWRRAGGGSWRLAADVAVPLPGNDNDEEQQ